MSGLAPSKSEIVKTWRVRAVHGGPGGHGRGAGRLTSFKTAGGIPFGRCKPGWFAAARQRAMDTVAPQEVGQWSHVTWPSRAFKEPSARSHDEPRRGGIHAGSCDGKWVGGLANCPQ